MKDVSTIYGASDDLLEVRSYFSEEMYPSDPDGFLIAVSDGTILHCEYNEDGHWKFKEKIAGKQFNRIISAIGDDGQHEDFPNHTSYSDIVLFRHDIDWVFADNELLKVGRKK